MELKYLQIYRLISNFATSLVGAFIPLILYEYTGSIFYAVLYIVLQRLMTVVLNKAFEKVVRKKPQIFLIFRVIPIIVFEVLTIFVDKSPILISCIIGVAYAFDYACNILPSEMIFSFNSTDDSAKTIGITRTIEQVGFVLAMILGSLFLDNMPIYYLIIMSISLYIISIIPLTMFYVKNRKNKLYNQEFISNAMVESDSTTAKRIADKVKRKYGLHYIFIQGIDVFYLLLPLVVFMSYGKFTYAAIMTAIYDTVLCVSGVLVGLLEKRRDLTMINSIACVLTGAISILFMILLPNTDLFVLECLLVFIISFTSAFPYIFTQNRMLMKARILGNSSECLTTMILSCAVSDVIVQSIGFFLPMSVPMIVGGVMVMIEGGIAPIIEESTRRDMVDYIQENNLSMDNTTREEDIIDIDNYKNKL